MDDGRLLTLFNHASLNREIDAISNLASFALLNCSYLRVV